ncbi:hypothetical protein [Alcanivorax sp. NBRC 102024]|uniref:hypothetical protein n=1 Tax=Alcanivorax sp. NBRC 102024 TaxID=1113895 RepID=UPI0018D3D50A|nr:hypothetical protein [Alcanivorax sp. NBRC 102024]
MDTGIIMDNHNIVSYLEAASGFTPKDLLPESLRISSGNSGLETFYAPFDWINKEAKLVICGITPGLQQANKALTAAISAREMGMDLDASLKMAKNTGSFAGAMRNNISKMLDHIKLNELLDINSCGQLFTDRQDLVHYTSALRYPVFKDKANYSGDKQMVSNPYLWNQAKQGLQEEIATLPEALWVPLGKSVVAVFEKLISEGVLGEDKVLFGLPHASGANAERIKYFLGEKPRDQLSSKVNPETIDAQKMPLLEKVRVLIENNRATLQS